MLVLQVMLACMQMITVLVLVTMMLQVMLHTHVDDHSSPVCDGWLGRFSSGLVEPVSADVFLSRDQNLGFHQPSHYLAILRVVAICVICANFQFLPTMCSPR